MFSPPPPPRPPRRDPRAGEIILQRNIFDSTLGPIPWDEPPPAQAKTEETPEQAEAPQEDLSASHPRCEGSIRLVGTYIPIKEPDQAFAAIINAVGTSLLYQEGMSVDDRLVVSIEEERVVLRNAGGSLCDLVMFGSNEGKVATASAAPAAPIPPVVVAEAPPMAGPDTAGLDPSELDANIRQISETSFTINRSLVEKLLANQSALLSAARVIPHEEDGRTVGMKIYGIRRSSLLGRIGLQNGDMLRSINGFDLTDPNSILQAYTQLRKADRLTLQLVRRGNPIALNYQIH
ncbi:MAG: type II secretion system protein GspC [Sandaracinaceae bacterium]|nr:type II secretion system protein GspC [Sandaracinaceae bacterium]